MAVVVVFDGPPPSGSPSEESLGSVTVIYAGTAVADDVIIRRLPSGREARQWVVVTDDRGLADRVRQRGSEVRPLAQWRAKPRATPRRARVESKLSSHDIADWEAYFGEGRPDDD
jgi:predicted RNA-binding protein with PIN domain